jgi:hypothetical protein
VLACCPGGDSANPSVPFVKVICRRRGIRGSWGSGNMSRQAGSCARQVTTSTEHENQQPTMALSRDQGCWTFPGIGKSTSPRAWESSRARAPCRRYDGNWWTCADQMRYRYLIAPLFLPAGRRLDAGFGQMIDVGGEIIDFSARDITGGPGIRGRTEVNFPGLAVVPCITRSFGGPSHGRKHAPWRRCGRVVVMTSHVSTNDDPRESR